MKKLTPHQRGLQGSDEVFRTRFSDKRSETKPTPVYVNFSPDRGMGARPFSKGPFPTRAHAEGWAMFEMAGQPANWWSIDPVKQH